MVDGQLTFLSYTFFELLSSLVALTPKVTSISPAPQSTIMANQLVTITFDMPIHLASSVIYVGTSSCRIDSLNILL